MFQHLTLLFSFIFAVAFTHILASVSDLFLARDRVRFSGLQALWMLYAALALLLSWIALLSFEPLKRWSMGEIMLQLSWIIPQYFTCSLVSLRVRDSGEIDMGATYERQRPVLFSVYVVFCAALLIEKFIDRNDFNGWKPADLIRVNAFVFVFGLLTMVLVAGWAKPRWLQWLAGCGALSLLIWDFFLFANSTFLN